jgi:hypothetical protein
MVGLSNMFFLMIKKHLSFIRYEVFVQRRQRVCMCLVKTQN